MTRAQGQAVGVVVAVVVLGTLAFVIMGLSGDAAKPRGGVVERVVVPEGVSPVPVVAPGLAAEGFNGVVVDGQGRPVADAHVLIGRPGYIIQLDPDFDRNIGGLRTGRTDADGRFSFPAGEPWSDVIARSSDGFAHVRGSTMPADGRIALRPWGRIEGTFRIGNAPAANQTLVYLAELAQPRPMAAPPPTPTTRGAAGRATPRPNLPDGSFVRQSITVRTDAEGRFVFEQVAPGAGRVARRGPPLGGAAVAAGGPDASRPGRMHILGPAEVKAGETLTMALGGTGRPVVGKVVFEGAAGAADVPPLEGTVTVRPAKQAGAAPPGQVDRPLSMPLTFAADGTFRAEDVPAGSHPLSIWAEQLLSDGNLERLAEGATTVTMPPIDGGRSDVPLDVGTVTVRVRPFVNVGMAAPPLEMQRAGGVGTIKLADYKGKHVVLMIIPPGEDASQLPPRAVMAGLLQDRAGGEAKLAIVAVFMPGQLGNAPKAVPAGWTVGVAADGPGLDRRYAMNPGDYLIDPEGVVLVRLSPRGGTGVTGSAAFAFLDTALGPMRNETSAEVQVERVATPEGSRDVELQVVPPLAADDAGRKGAFEIVDGQIASIASVMRVLNDGFWPRHDKDNTGMLAFVEGSLEGRVRADLKNVIEVERVSTYAWNKDGRKWAQAYRVYGSDGTDARFDAAPKIGVDPAGCGWTLIAAVDTRTRPGGAELRVDDRGLTAVNIHGKDGAALGKHRYLLFVMFAAETRDIWGQTMWSEIDIVGK